MTVSTIHRAIQPSVSSPHPSRLPVGAKPPVKSAEVLDTFERVAPTSVSSIRTSESPEMARLLEQVKAEKASVLTARYLWNFLSGMTSKHKLEQIAA